LNTGPHATSTLRTQPLAINTFYMLMQWDPENTDIRNQGWLFSMRSNV